MWRIKWLTGKGQFFYTVILMMSVSLGKWVQGADIWRQYSFYFQCQYLSLCSIHANCDKALLIPVGQPMEVIGWQ